MNIEEIRKQFPYLNSGKIYFNHAAVSPLPVIVTESVQKYIQNRSREKIDDYQSMVDTAARTKIHLGRLLNAQPDRIAFTKSVTDSLNILAGGINWNEGDRIILNDIEFPANVYPFLNLRRKGVIIDFVKSVNGMVTLEDIEKLIKPETKLLSISFVQFLSGFRADLTSIGKLCKENDIIFCVDAIQGAGVIPLDVVESQIDFLAGGSHKWLMGLTGLGYLYVTELLQNKINQPFAGWLSVEDEWDLLNYNLNFKASAERFHTGTMSFIGATALNASLQFLESVGYENIQNTVLENTSYFINKLSDMGLNPILNGVSKNNLAGIVTCPVNNAEVVFDKLTGVNIKCSLREGQIRFSPHFYNTKDEINFVLNEMKNVIT